MYIVNCHCSSTSKTSPCSYTCRALENVQLLVLKTYPQFDTLFIVHKIPQWPEMIFKETCRRMMIKILRISCQQTKRGGSAKKPEFTKAVWQHIFATISDSYTVATCNKIVASAQV